jgi:O-methyltransferase involved in polyketide biosynthesis
MNQKDPALSEVDVDRPSSARIYDYFLGGAHTFEVDRRAAADMMKTHPAAGLGMQANRSFLRRAVRYLCEQGIDQFLDLGSGIPTVGNVHEIAQRANPDAHVVYVDVEPIAVTHSNTILSGNDKAIAIQADMRATGEVLDHPDTVRLLDLSRPIGLIIAGVLQYIPDEDDPAAMIDRYAARMAAGSYVVLSHPSTDGMTEERRNGARTASAVYDRTATPFTYRSQTEFETFFAGLEMVEPGATFMWSWHPESEADAEGLGGRATGLAGVARKP